VLGDIAKMYARSPETGSMAARYYMQVCSESLMRPEQETTVESLVQIVTLCKKQDNKYKEANALLDLGNLYASQPSLESQLIAEYFYKQVYLKYISQVYWIAS